MRELVKQNMYYVNMEKNCKDKGFTKYPINENVQRRTFATASNRKM